MPWALKLAIMERSGMSRDEAVVELLTAYAESNRQLDIKLAKAMEFLTVEQITEVMGNLTS